MTDNQDRCPRCGGEPISNWIGVWEVCETCHLPLPFWAEWREMRQERDDYKVRLDDSLQQRLHYTVVHRMEIARLIEQLTEARAKLCPHQAAKEFSKP